MLTEELKEEGLVRELVRQIQQIRKEMKLVPAQRIVIYYQKSDFDKIILRNKKIILNEVLGDDIIIESEVKGGAKLSLDGQDIF